MVKSTTYKKLEAKLAAATKHRKALSATQAELIQRERKYTANIDDNNKDLKSIYRQIGYYQKKIKRQGRTVTKYEPKPGNYKATDKQQKYIDTLNNQIEKLTKKREKLIKSHRYKQAKRHWQKLTVREQTAYSDLFKYKNKRSIRQVPKPKKSNFNNFLAPHARIYPTESTSSDVVFLFSQSESESNQSDVTKYTVDKDEPISDHSRNSEKTLSIQGYVVGGKSIGQDSDNLKSAEHYYKQLLKYKLKGTQLTYLSNGTRSGQHSPHIYMHNLVITELDKTLDQPTNDSFKITITFEFVYKATVLSSKRNMNNKGKKDKKGKYAGAKHIKVKRGMDYYGLAKTYDTTVSQLERWNGPNLKVGSKVQVTAGHVASRKSATSSKTKIYQRRR